MKTYVRCRRCQGRMIYEPVPDDEYLCLGCGCRELRAWVEARNGPLRLARAS